MKSKRNVKTQNTMNKTDHQLYETWRNIIDKCEVKSNKAYKINKSRKIKVCDGWRESFDKFLSDMGERPENHYLKRRNKYLGYNKSNCYWMPRHKNRSCEVLNINTSPRPQMFN